VALNRALKPRPTGLRTASLSPGRVLTYAVLSVGAIVCLLPFIYMVLTSLKSYGSVINGTFWPWWPLGTESFRFDNYPAALQAVGVDRQLNMLLFFRYLFNSIFVTGCIVSAAVVTSILAAYALARLDLPGKNVLFIAVLAVLMVPEDATLVPRVVLIYNLHWYNTYWALIVPFSVNVVSIFLLRQFFLQFPKELFEAAVVDGMGHLRYLWSVMIPLSKPAILTVALLNFIWSWDSFKWPLLVTRDSSMRVLGVGLQQFKSGEGGTQVQELMVFATLVVVPIMLFYFLLQRQFREAITTVGIKG
jgi:multiple sugar transport system permease protein